ncbi:MAG: DEAD/DEAH box helicase, partial [Desulfurococcaceae archaeon]
CINCGYYREGRIRDFLGMSFNCPKCKYRSLTVVKSKNLVEREIVLKHSRNQKLNKSEKKILEDLRNKAILLSDHGDLALIILGSRGVSYNDAKTIISRVRNGGDLYEILYEYEKKVIKAKKFFEKKKRLKNN